MTTTLPTTGTADATELYDRLAAAEAAFQTRLDTLEAAWHERMIAADVLFAERLSLLPKLPTPCAVNVVDWGCKANDPTFDNGPLLNAGFTNTGIKAGNCNLEIYIPGGAFYFTTPLIFPARTGMAIRGNGLTYGLNEVAYWGKSQRGGPVSRLVYNGTPNLPAVTLNGHGTRWDGVVLQKGEFPEPRTEPLRDGSVGLCIAGGQASSGVNTGHHYFPSYAIQGFNTAIEASPLPVGQHADNCYFGKGQIQNCLTAIHLNNLQANNWHFTDLQTSFTVETVLEIDDGGDVTFGNLHLDSSSLVAKINKRSSHNPAVLINFLNVDNYCTGWRLLDAPTTGPLQFKCWGNVGKQVQAGPNPVNVNADRSQTTLDINLTQNGARLPW